MPEPQKSHSQKDLQTLLQQFDHLHTPISFSQSVLEKGADVSEMKMIEELHQLSEIQDNYEEELKQRSNAAQAKIRQEQPNRHSKQYQNNFQGAQGCMTLSGLNLQAIQPPKNPHIGAQRSPQQYLSNPTFPSPKGNAFAKMHNLPGHSPQQKPSIN